MRMNEVTLCPWGTAAQTIDVKLRTRFLMRRLKPVHFASLLILGVRVTAAPYILPNTWIQEDLESGKFKASRIR